MNEDYAAKADRVASDLLATYGTPIGYDEAQNLCSVAYLQGGRDELKRVVDEWDEHKARVLARIEGPADVAQAIVNDANRETAAEMVVNDELRKRKEKWGA